MVYGSTKSCSFNHAALFCWKWVAVACPSMWTQQLDFRTPWGELKQTGSIVTLWQQKDWPKIQSYLWMAVYFEEENLFGVRRPGSKGQLCHLSSVRTYKTHEFSWISAPVVCRNGLIWACGSQSWIPPPSSVMLH